MPGFFLPFVSKNVSISYASGFSLVELSIVLVILGLLTGGINAPRSKLGNAVWAQVGSGTVSGLANYYDGSYGNALFFGAHTSGATPQDVVLKPEEVWNIDTKMDDGKPAYGSLIVYKPAFHANCATSATASSAEYNLTYGSAGCALIAKNP